MFHIQSRFWKNTQSLTLERHTQVNAFKRLLLTWIISFRHELFVCFGIIIDIIIGWKNKFYRHYICFFPIENVFHIEYLHYIDMQSSMSMLSGVEWRWDGKSCKGNFDVSWNSSWAEHERPERISCPPRFCPRPLLLPLFRSYRWHDGYWWHPTTKRQPDGMSPKGYMSQIGCRKWIIV